MTEVVVIRTGTANLASVGAALERAGRGVRFSEDPTDAEHAHLLVLPGVGAFGPVAGRLDELRLREGLTRRIAAGRPTLAICLGLQLLAASSAENPGARGLGVVPATATAFRDGLRVPHLGWNRVTAGDGCSLLVDGDAYFANSYKLDEVPAGWAGATTDHGGIFVAALERGPVLGCQFHPELSGAWGQALIERWLAAASGVV
ncbi:MAG: imidazole glycerol phosphate synthase subunit HisH [Thermoanaerobaculales bacterium]|nr:imidazole glycerol phosphate synthase subunit HisH [Thermoanaerobaculales bacterium]